MQQSHAHDQRNALSLLASERPRNVTWLQSAGLLFGDWGTSRLYVLGLAFLFAGRTSFYLILMMSGLIVAVGWAYTQICRIYPDGGGVYTAAKHTSRTLAVVGALLLFADYTVTASLSSLDAFHYFGFPLKDIRAEVREKRAGFAAHARDAGDKIVLEHEDFEETPIGALPLGVTLPNAAPPASQPMRVWYIDGALCFAGEMTAREHDSLRALSPDPRFRTAVDILYDKSQAGGLWAWDSPGLWAIIAIAFIGLFNFMGPKHTGAFAFYTAVGMVLITLLISAFAAPQISWSHLKLGSLNHSPGDLWFAFISIVLALSGVEAVANLTGVMRKPVARTSRKAIWIVTAEVALFNIVLALCMVAIFPLDRSAHYKDMLAYLSGVYTDRFFHGAGEWMVRIVGGMLLLSAANTALTDMISVQYLMARDRELPTFMQGLNRFGVPWVPALIAASVPILVLLVVHDLDRLASLYAIGVIGAVAINVSLCSVHPRLRRMRRRIPMLLLGVVLLAIWVTLAYVKREALLFVTIVMVVGLSARWLTKFLASRKPRLSLLRQAIVEQLSSDALARPKVLLGTYGSDNLAIPALEVARASHAALVVCFIREVSLSYKWDRAMNIDTDLAAQKTFLRFLQAGQTLGVPVIPMYDTGPDAAELIAEAAAINGCEKVLLGSSRRGQLYQWIKGNFQKRLEALLPPEIPVQIILPPGHPAATPPVPIPA